ncbi:MAG: hypothetical protein PHF14_03750 [Verrucomicrobiota bacterium]|nr:hypothetical protein [Verrucomicrobiota bacterium]
MGPLHGWVAQGYPKRRIAKQDRGRGRYRSRSRGDFDFDPDFDFDFDNDRTDRQPLPAGDA